MRNTDQQDLAGRIARLERRCKALQMLLVVILVSIPGIAFVQAQPGQTPGLVEGTEFRLMTTDGRMAGRWAADAGHPQLALLSESGPIASLTPTLLSIARTDDLNSLSSVSLNVGTDSMAAGLQIAGGHGELRFLSLNGAPTLELLDDDGNTRMILGQARLNLARTGSTEITAPASILLLDEQGDVIWRAPSN